MWPTLLVTVYCLLIVLASMGGGWLPALISLTHTRMHLMMSMVGGLMLGVGVLHLLPHACAELAAAEFHSMQPNDHSAGASATEAVQVMSHAWSQGALGAMGGLLAMFLLMRVFQFHQHGEHGHGEHDRAEHGHSEHNHQHHSSGFSTANGRFRWVGLGLGLGLHTFIDGVALAASVAASSHAGDGFSLYGVGAFLAIALHKPLDALSITGVMRAEGWSPTHMQLVNIGFALMCPLGVAAFFLGIHHWGTHQHIIIGWSLAFAAGAFLCISLGDILPEIQFHAHDRVALSLALLLGAALAYGIGFLESDHLHAPQLNGAAAHPH